MSLPTDPLLLRLLDLGVQGFSPERALLDAGRKRLIKLERVPLAEREARANAADLHVAWRDDVAYSSGEADRFAPGAEFGTLLLS